MQETVFELLTQQYELARIQEAKDVPVVGVIDSPGIPEKKSFPPRLMLALLLTVIATSVAAALLLAWDRWLHISVSDPRKMLAHEIYGTLHARLRSPGPTGGSIIMRAHLANAGYGLLDYAAYPIGMLLVAPIVLHNMGAAQYGIWAIVTATVSMGSIIASGFGDANIQHVSSQRGLGQHDDLLRTVRCMIGINLVLGTTLALVAWTLAPLAARHIVPSVDRITAAGLSLVITHRKSSFVDSHHGERLHQHAARLSALRCGGSCQHIRSAAFAGRRRRPYVLLSQRHQYGRGRCAY